MRCAVFCVRVRIYSIEGRWYAHSIMFGYSFYNECLRDLQPCAYERTLTQGQCASIQCLLSVFVDMLMTLVVVVAETVPDGNNRMREPQSPRFRVKAPCIWPCVYQVRPPARQVGHMTEKMCVLSQSDLITSFFEKDDEKLLSALLNCSTCTDSWTRTYTQGTVSSPPAST